MSNYLMKGLLSVFLLLAIWNSSIGMDRPERQAINLALRQMAHNLYLLQGDDVSKIYPVNEMDDYQFAIVLNTKINYDTLPSVLDMALKMFKVQTPYMVSIKDCKNDLVLLGYSEESYEKGMIACKGREIEEYCAKVTLTFMPEDEEAKSEWIAPLIMLLAGGMAVLFLLFKRIKKRQPNQEESSADILDVRPTIGSLKFDLPNQQLIGPDGPISLTFRESKLLGFLVANINQVVSRDQIMSNVWEDEGVVVGRSLDVFVSRLRKILKVDETVEIKSVHGVGYRLNG